MIKIGIGVLISIVLYNFYRIYEDIKTPIYNPSTNSKYLQNGKKYESERQGNKNKNKNEASYSNDIENTYLYKPYTNFLSQFDKIDYQFYLSCYDHIELNKLFSRKDNEYAEKFINVFNFKDAIYHWDDSKIKKKRIFFFFTKYIYPSFDIIIPNKICNKKKNEVYLHIVTFVNKQLYRYGTASLMLTKKKRGDDTPNEKQFLWERFLQRNSREKEKRKYVKEKNKEKKGNYTGKEKETKQKENLQKKEQTDNSLYIPKIIQFGPVIEHNDIDIKNISYFSNVYIDKYKNTYFLPIYVNNYLTPEDEFQLFYSPNEKRDDSNVKRTTKNKKGENVEPTNENAILSHNKIKIEYVPITYTYFNLFNMIIFNIEAIKQKFNFSKYDLDSLTSLLCGSIYVVLFIYLICFVHILLDIIAIYFDVQSWRSGMDLYAFSSNTIHLNTIFTFIIFLYLKNKNESKIIMLFVLLKFFVCLWKLQKLYNIQILLLYPYIHVKKTSIINKKYSDIDEFENKFVKKLCYLMTFIIFLISIYNFIYNKYESFYSLIISSLAIYSYCFSFIFMLPQVIRNYYTKTVEHISMFSLFLLFLNTIIDDVFAIFIRMPQMHKFSVFRDDVVFIIFLVQCKLYKKKKVVAESEKKTAEKEVMLQESKKDK